MRLVPYGDEHLALSLAIECDPETMKYLGGARPREAVIEVHKRRVAIAAAGALYFVIVPDRSERPARSIGIWDDHEGEKIHEMGWTILPEFQGRGLATEAGRMIMERARAQPSISAVYAFPGIDNAASNAISRKLGFEMLSECDIEFSGRKLRCNNWRIDVSA